MSNRNIAGKKYRRNIKYLKENAIETTDKILNRWLDYEKYARSLKHNSRYHKDKIDTKKRIIVTEYNHNGYYKSKMLKENLDGFFRRGSEYKI